MSDKTKGEEIEGEVGQRPDDAHPGTPAGGFAQTPLPSGGSRAAQEEVQDEPEGSEQSGGQEGDEKGGILGPPGGSTCK